MTDDLQVATLLRRATDDLPSDPADLVRAGLERGRTRYRRRQVGGAVVAAAVLAVIGVGVALNGDDVSRAVDPPVADRSTPAASADSSATPGGAGVPDTPQVPRALAIKAADLPATWAALLPGQVSVPAPVNEGEKNPDPDYDIRDPTKKPFPASEPGSGIAANLTWNGIGVVVSVGPTDPTAGATAMERCVFAGEDTNGSCVALPDGGALKEVTFTADVGTEVRIVNRYTPDLWVVTASSNGPPAASPSLAQLETVAMSDVWFAAP